jgi:3-phosphoshikimate 1-carboxyvinyltransferase
MTTYPPELEIVPLTVPPHATVSVPGSKSITNRALVLAALASQNGPCELTGPLWSEDTTVMVDALSRLGFILDIDWSANHVVVHRNATGRIIPKPGADLFVANSGTTMRFLTAVVSTGHGRYRLDGVPRMRERPIEDLLTALRMFGVDARSEAGNGCPPVIIESNGWERPTAPPIPGTAVIRSNVSSQFLSGLMMAAPFSGLPYVSLFFDEHLVSRPYLEMTDAMLKSWGIATNFAGRTRTMDINAKPNAYLSTYAIEPDASAASYFFAAAAITGGTVTVRGMKRDMLQGDVRFVDALQEMGCEVADSSDGIKVRGRPLRGVDVDMNDISDTVMTLAAVACFADGPTTIRNVAHIRHKETDRIAAVGTELRKLGGEVEEYPDGLKITPQPLKGCAVETYNDHRMAMSLALVGLKVPGVIIKNPGCVAKTYPGFWQDFEKLRG